MVDFDDSGGQPRYSAGCGSMALAAIVGYPLGSAVALQLTGEPGLGGFVGIFVMIFVFGWLGNRARDASDRGYRLPGPLGSGKFWGAISLGLFVAIFMPWGTVFPGLGWLPFPASIIIGVMLYRRDRKRAQEPPFPDA